MIGGVGCGGGGVGGGVEVKGGVGYTLLLQCLRH